jgi:hypothetical protein
MPVPTTSGDVSIPIQADIKTVEAMLRNAGVRLQPAVTGPDYAVDIHFEEFVLNSIKTTEDAADFLTQLDLDAGAHSPGSKCQKAERARRWLSDSFWTARQNHIRAAIAVQRRICCGCHETGSFSPR